jgi:hypothetical protein
MRALGFLAVLALVAAPIVAAPNVAYADGIERPRPPRVRPRPRPRPAPPPAAPAPAPVIEDTGPETVTLNSSFFSGGGVGADIGVNSYYSSTTVIIRGGHASASAFAFASARASARGGGWGHGGGKGGCGCR